MSMMAAGICSYGARGFAGLEQQLQKQGEACTSCGHNNHRAAASSIAGSRGGTATSAKAAEHRRSHEALLRY